MKLRNKKTGETVDADFNATISGRTNIIIIQKGPEQLEYTSLAELNEEWEDYEEPKEYFYIYADGDIYKDVKDDLRKDNGCKEIGNYFETREEAEKAVEKLKAWKRLRDKGFEFEGYDDGYKHDFNSGHIEFYVKNDGDVLNDLDLLFCTEVKND